MSQSVDRHTANSVSLIDDDDDDSDNGFQTRIPYPTFQQMETWQ